MARYISFLQGISDPKIQVFPNPVDIGLGYTDFESNVDLKIMNIGLATLTVSQIDISGTGYTFTCDTPCDIEPGAVQNVAVAFNSTTTGTFTGDLTIASNDVTSGTVIVPLTIEVVEPPDIDLSLTSIDVNVDVGSSGQGVLNIANLGVYNLDYTIKLNNPDVAAYVSPPPVMRENARILRKGEFDNRPAGQSLDNSGGPDQFGYIWKDSNEPNGPEYEWFDISPFVTATGLTGDDASITLDLPFEFPFYDGAETSVNVSSNGYLTFGTSGTEFTNGNFPDSSIPNAVIAPFWDDMVAGESSANYAYFDSENQRFIIQYSHWMFYGSDTGDMNFQAHLYESGEIRFYYETLDGNAGASATVGIENYNGGDGLEIAFNNNYITENMAVQITSGPPWLSCDVTNGTLSATANEDVTFTCDSHGLPAGDYEGVAIIRSNDPDEGELTVTITMTVSISSAGEIGLIPETTELQSCYPNPFNPTTIIPFKLSNSEHVTLEVINVLGQRVAVLVNEKLNAGSYQITWNSRDLASLTSGTYFYRMTAGSYTNIQKMVLVK
jgi:Secretion system C-terminal sorting domain/HYDIN/CFA65/VesB-like, Ig-like domain/Nidogen-like